MEIIFLGGMSIYTAIGQELLQVPHWMHWSITLHFDISLISFRKFLSSSSSNLTFLWISMNPPLSKFREIYAEIYIQGYFGQEKNWLKKVMYQIKFLHHDGRPYILRRYLNYINKPLLRLFCLQRNPAVFLLIPSITILFIYICQDLQSILCGIIPHVNRNFEQISNLIFRTSVSYNFIAGQGKST